jgi:hypothetical protein
MQLKEGGARLVARIRTIKPEFWTDGDVMDLSPFARLLFIGSWNFAMCDFGHVADDPRRLKMQVLPSDDVDGVALVDELVNAGRMVRVTVDGRSFLHIKRFTDHQKTEKRWTPRCPVCAETKPPTNSPNLSRTPPTSAPERKGEERRGEKTNQSQTVTRVAVDDDGLTKIQELTKGTKTHARKCVEFVLSKTSNDIKNPTAYVLKAIREDPDSYRYKRGNPKRGEECLEHAGQWADACAGCAADRKAKA